MDTNKCQIPGHIVFTVCYVEYQLKEQLKIQKEGKDDLKQRYKYKEIAFINKINKNLFYFTEKEV
jgi:hypothetical protein